MDDQTAQGILELLKAIISKPDGVVTAAYITVGGMFGVALIAAIAQWSLTKRIIRSEHDKLYKQLNSEFKSKQFEYWQSEFKEVISQLLSATDPEISSHFDKSKIIPLIHKAQLNLDVSNPSHRKVNGLILQLARAVNGWEAGHDAISILKIHGALADAAKEILYIPKGKN